MIKLEYKFTYKETSRQIHLGVKLYPAFVHYITYNKLRNRWRANVANFVKQILSSVLVTAL